MSEAFPAGKLARPRRREEVVRITSGYGMEGPFAYYNFVLVLRHLRTGGFFDTNRILLVLWRCYAGCGTGIRAIYRGGACPTGIRGHAPPTLNVA